MDFLWLLCVLLITVPVVIAVAYGIIRLLAELWPVLVAVAAIVIVAKLLL
jgi:hypothetical protein